MKEYLLERTNMAPLGFRGVRLAEASGQKIKSRRGDKQIRWHELRLYRTATSQLVLEIRYCTEWEGEIGWSTAFKIDERKVADCLLTHDPTEYVRGFPERSEFARRQKNLLDWIEKSFRELVGQLLAQAEITERVQ